MSTFAILDPSSELSHGECSPTSLYQTLQTLHLQSTQPGPPAAATAAATAAFQHPQFSSDAVFRPDEPNVNGPHPVDVIGPSFAMDALQMAGAGDDLRPGPSSSYAVPLVHPNLQMIREDVASSQSTVSDSGGRSDSPQRHTVSPPHPVISITDALGRVMPVVMVTQGDAPTSDDAVPMDDSTAASLVNFPAGYFAGYSNYAGNYVTVDSPLDLSNAGPVPTVSRCNDRGDLCSTIIRTQRSACDLYCDLSRALESSSAKELVQRCDVESGLFALANASVSLEVRVCHGTADEHSSREKATVEPGAALCFCHLAGDVALYDSICCELVSRLSL